MNSVMVDAGFGRGAIWRERAGFAIVRDGEPVDFVWTIMN